MAVKHMDSFHAAEQVICGTGCFCCYIVVVAVVVVVNGVKPPVSKGVPLLRANQMNIIYDTS